MNPGFHGRAEMLRAESGRACEKHSVHTALDYFLKRVQSGELSGFRNVHLVAEAFEISETVGDRGGESVTQRPEFHVRIRRQRLGGRTRAAPAAADQSDLENLTVLGRLPA